MTSDRLRMYIIEVLLLIFSLCCIIFSGIFTKTVIAVVLFLFMIISNILIKSCRLKGKYNRKITPLMIIIGLVYIAFIYVLGIYIGFYTATVKFSKWTLLNYVIPHTIIIIAIENIRKTILLKEEKKSQIILLIATVILDVAIAININNVKSLKDYFMLIGFIVFSSIANNLLYNHIIIKYQNCKAIIAYRLILTLYLYIIPIVPNMHILFESVLKMILPYIIYLVLKGMYGKKEIEFFSKKKTRDIVLISILIIFLTILLMLISCQFKYGMLVIGSGSMTGTINKGDVIIYETLDEIVNIGDIIVFNNNGTKIIHRVIDKKDSGTGTKYYTKGDANPNQDKGYREIEDIIGKVRFTIPQVGQLTVLLNEMFVQNGG